jgi:hypothetical protein
MPREARKIFENYWNFFGPAGAKLRSIYRCRWGSAAGPHMDPEDIRVNMYPAAGIGWTRVRHDHPRGGGIECAPTTDGVAFYPINELQG